MKRTAAAVAWISVMLLGSLAHAGEETIRLQEAPGRDLTSGRCIVCHSLDYIEMNAVVMDRPGWERTIRKMIDRFGAPISDREVQEILEYLTQHYSSAKTSD